MNTPKFHQFGVFLCGALVAASALAFNPSTQPPQSTAVPGNLLLTLSVEHPTGLQVSYTGGYSTITNYDGYFDNRKCYTYNTTNEVFRPTSAANSDRSCPSAATEWSGNLLNWLTMTNLDQFRSVMTGGTRDDFSAKSGTYPGDTTERTVLIRSFSDREAYNPNKQILTTTPGVPTGLRTVNRWVRSAGYGSKFIINNVNNNWANWDGTVHQRASCANSPLPGATGTSQCFNIRVEVCVAVGSVPREANCQARYSGVAKPEGLIQEYANALRFGAFGYLNQTGDDRNGGVLRAAMKSVGPLAATRTGVVANDRREWNATTGILWPNPDSDDAAASGVADSGVINYLNKFGYAAGYKGNDPVSELFYAAQRYMRGYALPNEYTNDLNDARRDGFPVITGNNLTRGQSRDPMINTCQKNFMLAIGDIFVHCDGNLPGSNRASCPGGTPTDPDNLNVQNLWDNLRALEGMPDARDSTGVNGWAGGAGTRPTPYVAGLAHWANTNDIRSDLAGEQRISTYFVDVIENGNNVGGLPNAATLRSQYWLAAKYGGFDTSVVTGNNPNQNVASWDADGNRVPDTWFAGSTPSLMRSGLSAAFADIATRSSANSASSAAVSSSRQTSDSQIIYAGYNPQNWSGTLRACRPTQTATECANSPTWEASSWFKTTPPTLQATPLTAATRKIFTSWRTATGFSSMPFQWASLNTAQRAALQPNDSRGEDRLNYLRGDRTNEVSVFRRRHEKLLGDIVNSGVLYVGGQGPAYFGTAFAGHSAYRNSNKNRSPVVYVGANDGMLHAFSAADGKELFGYIPSTVYPNLAGLSDLNFQHKYFVDSTPMVADFQKTNTVWGTMLVGGLGAGGRGFYALDITNQDGFASASENVLSAIPMWEFTAAQDSDLGYTFNEPSIDPVTGANLQIAKVADATVEEGVWRVIVGNGFGSANGDAVLFMLNARTGAKDIELLAHNGTENGLATPTPVDTDRDGLIDTIYAGDLEGNLHKFQFSKLQSGSYVLASPSETGGQWRHLGIVLATGQPVTTAPSVAKDEQGWIVSFGTGKLNEDSDYTDSTSRYGFYSLLDNEPSQSLTVNMGDLAQIQYTETTLNGGLVGRTWTSPNLLNRKGWWMEFRQGERILSNPTVAAGTGTVLFATTRPSGDACDPNNSGFIMGVKLIGGASNTLNVNDQITGGLSVNSTGVVKLSPTYTGSDNEEKVVCNQDGCKPPPPSPGPCDPATNDDCKCTINNGTETCEERKPPPGVNKGEAPRGRYNWREILTK